MICKSFQIHNLNDISLCKKITGLSFLKVVSTYMLLRNSDICLQKVVIYAKQKHPGHKKVQGQSEAALQTGRCDQKL